MTAVQVDGNDVEAVYEATAEAANRARSGGGPTFIECMTYRHRGHSRTDPAKYRDPKEVEAWLARDPLKLYEAALVKRKLLTRDKAEKIIVDERAAARAASERAATSPWPGARHRLPSPNLRLRTAMQEITYREAILAALQEEMRRDDKILIMGEDIGPSGGPFKTCQGLYEEFGAARVRDTPIAETGFVGAAARPRPHRLPADRRDHVRRFPRRLLRPDRQLDRQAPLHVGRQGQGAAGDPRHRRRRPPLRRPALADRRVVDAVGARPHHRLPVLAERGLRHAPGRDPRRQPGRGVRAQGAPVDQGPGRHRRAARRRSPGRGCSVPAATPPSSRA